MTLLLLIALAQEPPSLDAESRARIAALESRVAAVEARLGMKAAPVVTQPISATEFSPTWHYPPNTVLVQDANGVLVPSQAATQISYPGGQMQAAPPPQFYAPPPMRGGPLRGFGRAFRGANCSGGS